MLKKLRDKIIFKLSYLIDFIFIQLFFKFFLLLRGTHVPFSAKISKFLINWPHQLSIGHKCVFEHNLIFKYDSTWRNGPNIIIGENCFIGNSTEFNISERISVGDNCLIASNCKFIDHNHGFSDLNKPIRLQEPKISPILIEDNVWIGANCIILKGVTIGTGSVIGAGSVVTKNVPPNEIWCGSPAKFSKKRL
jgi:acetyltransferase-like isoleucine patch superfamily enzyme